MEKYRFPSIQKTIDDFINDDDGNITRQQLVTIGAMILVMSIMSSIDAYAKHQITDLMTHILRIRVIHHTQIQRHIQILCIVQKEMYRTDQVYPRFQA